MESAAKKLKAAAVDMEATTTKKVPNIFIVDVVLHIFRFLDIEDRIAFALSCQQSRQLCIDGGVFRKLDLSRSMISTPQREVMKRLFRDRQLTRHIRELNLSNLRVLNWKMDDHLEKIVKSICPQLEALHVLNCGVSLKTLQCILREAYQLTSLSWSLLDFTSEDIEFLLKTMESPEGICFKNIKHLHIEMDESLPQIQIAKYLLLSCCRDLEVLEICTWQTDEAYFTGGSLSLLADEFIPGFPEPSVENELQHLHSLVVAAVGRLYYEDFDEPYRSRLYDFIISILSRKPSSTKWRKFCIIPATGISREHFSLLLHKVISDDFQSVQAIGVDPDESADAVDELKSLFARIGGNTVKSLQLHLPPDSDSIVEFCETISRVAGHSLKMLRLSVRIIHAEQNVLIHSFFSNCSNITELDLLDCIFEKDICEPLSELNHLIKLQLRKCAVSSKYDENDIEISKANLVTFVENCKNITHLDVHGCWDKHEHFSCCLTDGDLLALAELSNLKSLTLWNISGITEWTFLQNISENCKFLTMLRIAVKEHFNNSHIPILMEASRFLKHLAINVDVLCLGSEVFWNLLGHAKNLERLCIRSWNNASLNVPVAVEAIKSLPRLHVLHMHSCCIENADDFYDQLIKMLEEKETDCRFSFEIVTENRMDTWINHPTGYSLIPDKALPSNEVELCNMTPILEIPRL